MKRYDYLLLSSDAASAILFIILDIVLQYNNIFILFLTTLITIFNIKKHTVI